MKDFNKKQLDILWPTMSNEKKEQIFQIAKLALAELTAEMGFVLTEKTTSSGLIPSKIRKKKYTRYMNIKVHDRVFKDRKTLAKAYGTTLYRVNKIIKDFGIDQLEQHFKPIKSVEIYKRRMSEE